MKTIDLLYEAIDTYGRIAQITKAIEEMGELTVELSKYLNGDCARYHNIASEIADVQIMLKQLELIFNNETEVKASKVYKLQRLQKRLQEFKVGGSM